MLGQLRRQTTLQSIRQRSCRPALMEQLRISGRAEPLTCSRRGYCCSTHSRNSSGGGGCRSLLRGVATRERGFSSAKTGSKPSPQTGKQWLVELLCSDPDFQSVWEQNVPSSSASAETALLQPLDYVPLDRESRYLLGLLDDAYHGVRRGIDCATTARCNKMIEKLSDMSRGGKSLKGRAQRADAILQRMERFRQFETGAGDLVLQHKQPLRKQALPLPNHTTYFHVLRLYTIPPVVRGSRGALVGPEVPRRAEALIQTMNRLYKEEGQLEMKPSTGAWNQVLSCWAVSSDTDKAYHAASLLKRLENMADASSYSQVFRACALYKVGDNDSDNERARELGYAVAQRIWNDMEKLQAEMTSFTITFFLRAMGGENEPLPRPRQRNGGEQQEDYIQQAFQRSQEKGLVNAHVLFELVRVAPYPLLQDLLGPECAALAQKGEKGGGGGGEDMTKLLRRIPASWKRNAKQKTEMGW